MSNVLYVNNIENQLSAAQEGYEELSNDYQHCANQLAEMTQAVGLATTLNPDMEIDSSDPIGMMRKVEAHINQQLTDAKAAIAHEADVADSYKEQLEQQTAQLAEYKKANLQNASDMLRLLETIKYLRGIAERGLAKSCSDDETVEQFVLGYVKSLEAVVRQQAAHIGELSSGDNKAVADLSEYVVVLEDKLEKQATQIALLREVLEHVRNVLPSEVWADDSKKMIDVVLARYGETT